jgi:hypothetical protein
LPLGIAFAPQGAAIMERFLSPEAVRQLHDLATDYAIPMPRLEQVAMTVYSDGIRRAVADWRESQEERWALVLPQKVRRQA